MRVRLDGNGIGFCTLRPVNQSHITTYDIIQIFVQYRDIYIIIKVCLGHLSTSEGVQEQPVIRLIQSRFVNFDRILLTSSHCLMH